MGRSKSHRDKLGPPRRRSRKKAQAAARLAASEKGTAKAFSKAAWRSGRQEDNGNEIQFGEVLEDPGV